MGHFKQLGLALLNYESTYGCLPPAYVADAQGEPLYSWRVLILPFLEEQAVYQAIRLDEPWNGPNNSKLHSKGPDRFFCPNDPEAAENGFTSVLGVVGPGTLFPGGGKSARLADIRDDPDSTLMLVESDNAKIHWMEPRDLDWDAMSFQVNDRSRPSISSKHRAGAYGGPLVATATDGISSLHETTPPADVKAMLLINDGAVTNAPLGTRPR